MKHPVLSLMLFVTTPAVADVNCKTVADGVTYHDQLIKTQVNEFATRYGDNSTPKRDTSMEIKQDYLKRLDGLINTLQHDIDGMRWLIGHHCGPAQEEPNAIKSVHDMQLMLTGLIVRRMDARALR
jgi:hypothetical protein